MPITERTLKRWRKDALHELESWKGAEFPKNETSEMAERVLRLTQELLDQHLMQERKSTQTKRGE